MGAAAEAEAMRDRIRPARLAHSLALPVQPAFGHLLPRGLLKGSAVSVTSAHAGATTLALAVAARPEPTSSWVAAVGLPDLGLVAAFELGLSLERLVMVDCPARKVPEVVAALVDGFDVIMIGPSTMNARDARRLVARLRERGAVVIVVGGDLPSGQSVLRLRVTSSVWDDPTVAGYLQRRRLRVAATGRGAYAGHRSDELPT